MTILENDQCICHDKNTAVALGLFDGVHLGHQKVIKKAVEKKSNNISPAVFTFDTQSITTKCDNGKLDMLLTNEDKFDLLKNIGIEYVFSPSFSKFKNMTDKEFVKMILKDKLNASVVVCGDDFKFGKNAMGNAQSLKALGEKYDIEVCIVKKIAVDGKIVSSTHIRELIQNGHIAEANKMLGYNYGYTLTVEHGDARGRTWNFPTINQIIPKELVTPRFGVYCSKVTIDDKKYMGVTNIGIRPTVKTNGELLAETNIVDFDGNLYGKKLKLELFEFVRDEKKFDSFEEVKAEIGRNKQFAINYFKNKFERID